MRTNRIFNILVVSILVWSSFGFSGSQQAAAYKALPQLSQLATEHPDQVVRVIVQKIAVTKDAELLVVDLGGRVISDLSLINAFSAEMTAKAALELAQAKSVRWVSLDAPVRAATEGDSYVRDEFNEVSYSNEDGSEGWTNSWIETGDWKSAPNRGNIRINSGYLSLKGQNSAISRMVNLADTMRVTLSFEYKRSGLDNPSDYVDIEISADGGSTWTELARFMGPGSDKSWQSASFDVLSFASTDTTIRFTTSPSLGMMDILYIDNVQIEYAKAEPLPLPPPTTTGLPQNYYLDTLNVRNAWDMGLSGEGIAIAIIDSGISHDGDFTRFEKQQMLMNLDGDKFADDQEIVEVTWQNHSNSRILEQIYFCENSPTTADIFGHGTLVAGVAAGNGSMSQNLYQGIAPKADLISLKIADGTGMAYESDVVAALQWVYENKYVYNIRVVNISLNTSEYLSYHTSPMDAAVEILWFNGVVVVVSAGNRSVGNDFNPVLAPPANDPFVITVGATEEKGDSNRNNDKIASFSAFDETPEGFSKPEIHAPGKDIISVLSKVSELDVIYPDRVVAGEEYFRASGTSLSAPMVAGTVALLLQGEPDLTPDQVKYRLINTSGKVSQGNYLDVYAAVATITTESANTGIEASQMLWTGTEPITWTSVGWNSVGWNSVGWNSVGWNSVGWNSVGWNSTVWDE
jgi:serine protease AprX